MNPMRSKRGFTLVELIVVIVIVVFSIAILIPFVNSAREAGRTSSCHGKQMMIALALQNYASTYNNCYPPSASVTTVPGGGTQTVGGWSLMVRLLSFMDYDAFYKTLPQNGDPEDTSNLAIVAAMNTQCPDLICPSGPRGAARYASKVQQTAGITNYKAMGASTRDSLAIAANPQAPPPYGTMSPIAGTVTLHPDGAMFPGAGLRAADVRDGLSHTIFIIETIDESASRWTVGKEATLVGLPQKSSPTGTTAQAAYNFFAPPGYDGTFGEDSGVAKAGLRTFVSYDFSPKGADAGTYEDPGFSQTPPAYGPSSMHPAVVIVGFGDASTQSISKQIDAANFFFLITKNNSDPFYMP